MMLIFFFFISEVNFKIKFYVNIFKELLNHDRSPDKNVIVLCNNLELI